MPLLAWLCLCITAALLATTSFVAGGIGHDARTQGHGVQGGCAAPMADASAVTAFWINLDSSSDRREYMEALLGSYGFRDVRVPAFNPKTSEYRDQLKSLHKPCKRNTDTDVAVVMSHLRAIHTAVYRDPSPSPYALILEDDVRFLFSVNFTALIRSAPKDFGILQLTTSNTEALDLLWGQLGRGQHWVPTHWRNATKNGKTYLYWSAQAYVIQKSVVRPFVDLAVRSDGYRIHNSFYPESCRRTEKDPCVLAFCLFSDSYIYAAAQPSYVSTAALVTGGRIGWNSTIHPLEVNSHRAGFAKIRSQAAQLRQAMRSSSRDRDRDTAGPEGLRPPPYLSPLPSC